MRPSAESEGVASSLEETRLGNVRSGGRTEERQHLARARRPPPSNGRRIRYGLRLPSWVVLSLMYAKVYGIIFEILHLVGGALLCLTMMLASCGNADNALEGDY